MTHQAKFPEADDRSINARIEQWLSEIGVEIPITTARESQSQWDNRVAGAVLRVGGQIRVTRFARDRAMEVCVDLKG